MRFLLLFLGLLPLAGCGGSGNAVAGAQSDLLTGDYRYVELRALGGVAVSATTARVQSDGVSSLAFGAQTTYSEGAFIGPVIGGMKSYTISPERNFALPDDGIGGRISEDGMIAAGATRNDPSGWVLLFRYQNAPALSDLTGTWAVMTYYRAFGMYDQGALRKTQTITLGGVGDLAGRNFNLDGVINPAMLGGAVDEFYTVEPDGTLRLDTVEHGDLVGDLSEDGNLMVFAGSATTGTAVVRVLVRLDNQPAMPDFAGTYGFSSWETDAGTPTTRWGTWSPSGAHLPVSIGSPAQPIPTPQNYDLTFDASGWFTADRNPAVVQHRWIGAVAASGSYGFAGGGWRDGNRPTLSALIR